MLYFAFLGLLGLILIALLMTVRFLRLDGDLGPMWAERFRKKPGILKGQVVWITGSSSGIGEYLAYELAKAGCRLVLSARRVPQLESVKKQCLTYGSLRDEDVLVLPLDVTDIPSHKPATDKVISTFGQIDVLVNNAGRSQRAWVMETELAVDRAMIELNVIGQLSITKCVLPHMVERKQGHIAVTSSLAGKMGAPYSATYCLAKFALHGYFQALAIEMLSHNIGITLVCPGPVYSNFSKVAFKGTIGKVHGESTDNDPKRMSTQRCAELFVVAIANKLSEVWICPPLYLAITYASQHIPDVVFWMVKKVGIEKLMKMREGL